MFRFRPYESGDAAAILSWVSDETAFYKWSAGRLGAWPITAEAFDDYYRAHPELLPFTMTDESGPAGHLLLRRIHKAAAHFLNRAQPFHGAFTHAVHQHHLFPAGIQQSLHAAEAIQQLMGQFIHILPGHGWIEQHFHHFMGLEIVHSFPDCTFAHPFPVAFVQIGKIKIIHKDSVSINRSARFYPGRRYHRPG